MAPKKSVLARDRYCRGNFVIDAAFKARVHELARRLDRSESDVIRAALRDFLASHARSANGPRRRRRLLPRRKVSL